MNTGGDDSGEVEEGREDRDNTGDISPLSKRNLILFSLTKNGYGGGNSLSLTPLPRTAPVGGGNSDKYISLFWGGGGRELNINTYC